MPVANVDAYLEAFSGRERAALDKVRAAIRAALPQAEETISYDMPAFVAHGKKVVWFAGLRTHVGFYPGAAAIRAFHERLARYKTAKGSVQFPYAGEIPVELVGDLTRYRLEQL